MLKFDYYINYSSFKMYKMNLSKMFFLLLIFCGVTCSAQCNVEDSLFFCPKGYYKILKIDKIKNSEDKEYFYEGLKSRKKVLCIS